MSLFAKRGIAAGHFRPSIVPDGNVSFASLGAIRVHVPLVEFAPQSEEFVSAPTEAFQVYFDPSIDLRAGDVLVFSGHPHEVRIIQTFTGKRSDLALADVFRREVPAFTLP